MAQNPARSSYKGVSMRHLWRRTVLASCLAFLSPLSFPQTPDPDVAALHEGLRALQATMEKALNAGDIDTLLANVDDNVVFTTMNGDVARGKDGIRQYYERMMKGPDRVVESVTTDFIPDDLSILHGGNMAIAYGRTDDHYVLTDGNKFDIQARWTGTLLHRDGKWIVGAFHYSANVFDNPILEMQRRMLIIAAVVAMIVAAALGVWIGRRKRRAA
jgi:uncharacterized protein (TIGR02246 family)